MTRSLTSQSEKFFGRPENGPDIRIFLDLDGVVADFDAHADNAGARTQGGRIDWKKTNYAWWKTMPPAPGAKAFYDAALQLAPVKFLSGPSLDEESFSGKAAWVQSFVPERGKAILRDLILCSAESKHFLAGPARILIDDSSVNVSDWRKAGGIAIHHKGDFARTLKELEAAIAKLSAPPKPAAPKGPQP